jgi:hypothetical protein
MHLEYRTKPKEEWIIVFDTREEAESIVNFLTEMGKIKTRGLPELLYDNKNP